LSNLADEFLKDEEPLTSLQTSSLLTSNYFN